MGFFAILFLLHSIASPFFQSAHGFSLAKRALRWHLRLAAHFSTPREDTSSVVSGVLTHSPPVRDSSTSKGQLPGPFPLQKKSQKSQMS